MSFLRRVQLTFAVGLVFLLGLWGVGIGFRALAGAPASSAEPSLVPGPVCELEGVARVVAIGDVHGEYAGFVKLLQLAQLVDTKTHWIGGKAHLVQTGDKVDRGARARDVLELVMRLEQEARAAGGAVHALLGNHEVMQLKGQLRYAAPEELAAYADLSTQVDSPGMPRGLLGHQAGFAMTGRYGRWLRGHAAAIRVNDSLFVHGGISPSLPAVSLAELNQRVRQDIFPGTPSGWSSSPEGPLWYRGYAQDQETGLAPGLMAVLKRYKVNRMVMGHTPTGGSVTARFAGRAIFIDAGLNPRYGSHLSALEIEGGKLNEISLAGRKPLVIPKGPTPGL